jgi:hypothetical protein
MSEIPHQDLFRPADLLVALDCVVTAGKTTDDNEIFAESTNEATSRQVVCELSAPSSPDVYAAASIAITSSGSSTGSASAFVIDSALM